MDKKPLETCYSSAWISPLDRDLHRVVAVSFANSKPSRKPEILDAIGLLSSEHFAFPYLRHILSSYLCSPCSVVPYTNAIQLQLLFYGHTLSVKSMRRMPLILTPSLSVRLNKSFPAIRQVPCTWRCSIKFVKIASHFDYSCMIIGWTLVWFGSGFIRTIIKTKKTLQSWL